MTDSGPVRKQTDDGGCVSDSANGVEPADASKASETDRDGLAWKVNCRECGELVPAKPYCYECGAARPADGNYYVETSAD